ncbi:MAG: MFS transporter [Planctomycetota bacterium]
MDSSAPRTPPGVMWRLSIMMFLQYAIWGAWLPLFFQFLTQHRGFSPEATGTLFSIGAVGALAAPFVAGQIADRWFATQRFLGISHLAGGALVWWLATVESYTGLLVVGVLYSLIYAPTLPLTNSLSFHHLADRDRDFGKVRVWGTVGWIVAGIGMGQWLLHMHTPSDALPDVVKSAQFAGMADSFKLSAILGTILGFFCFTLPDTPPQKGKQPFAAAEAFKECLQSPLLVLFLIAFPISCVHQFYFVHTAGFLNRLDVQTPWIDAIFGVGGGGAMTIGQMAEIAVLAFMPLLVKKFSRKTLLLVGLTAYVARFAVFAYLPTPTAVFPALALHGLCFDCFFFICFMIVDENTTSDVRASAQSLFNLVIIGFGTIVGNLAAGRVDAYAAGNDQTLFSVPMFATIICLFALLLFYPNPREKQSESTP